MNLHTHVAQFISTLPGQQPLKFVLGLSGGPDSVCLFDCLLPLHKEGAISLVAAHLDHGWRKDSNEDVEFCRNLATTNGVPFVSKQASELGTLKWNGSKEDVGRKLRRRFFESVLRDQQADYIALGHHKNDQMETFFLRLIRGASLQGLTGMRAITPPYIRPLLTVNKSDITDHLQKTKLSFLTDPTNASSAHLRNRIRAEVLPALSQCDNRFEKTFGSTLEQLQEVDAFLSRLTLQTMSSIFTQNGESVRGNLAAFRSLDPVLQKRILITWLAAESVSFTASTSFLDEVLRFLNSTRGGSHAISTSAVVHKKHGVFWVESAVATSLTSSRVDVGTSTLEK